MIVLLRRSGDKKQFRFSCKRKLVVLEKVEQCLKNFGFKFQQFYIMAAATIPEPGIGFNNYCA